MAYDFHTSLAREMALFDEKFKDLIAGDFEFINHISGQIFQSKGKQLRPVLVFQAYKLYKEEVSEQAYLAASLVEVVHAASLVHDDVVDMADMRRGNASIRAMFGNKVAVLAGDYLLTNAFLRAYGESDIQLLIMLVEVIRQMSGGELLQLQYANNRQANEDAYFRIVGGKTAALFGCCCQCGAYAAGASSEEVEKTKEIGRQIGLAFQIKDDLLEEREGVRERFERGQTDLTGFVLPVQGWCGSQKHLFRGFGPAFSLACGAEGGCRFAGFDDRPHKGSRRIGIGPGKSPSMHAGSFGIVPGLATSSGGFRRFAFGNRRVFLLRDRPGCPPVLEAAPCRIDVFCVPRRVLSQISQILWTYR